MISYDSSIGSRKSTEAMTDAILGKIRRVQCVYAKYEDEEVVCTRWCYRDPQEEVNIKRRASQREGKIVRGITQSKLLAENIVGVSNGRRRDYNVRTTQPTLLSSFDNNVEHK